MHQTTKNISMQLPTFSRSLPKSLSMTMTQSITKTNVGSNNNVKCERSQMSPCEDNNFSLIRANSIRQSLTKTKTKGRLSQLDWLSLPSPPIISVKKQKKLKVKTQWTKACTPHALKNDNNELNIKIDNNIEHMENVEQGNNTCDEKFKSSGQRIHLNEALNIDKENRDVKNGKNHREQSLEISNSVRGEAISTFEDSNDCSSTLKYSGYNKKKKQMKTYIKIVQTIKKREQKMYLTVIRFCIQKIWECE